MNILKTVMHYALIVLFGSILGLAAILGIDRVSEDRNYVGPSYQEGAFQEFTDAFSADLVLVTLSTCPFCEKAAAFLEEREIGFRKLVLDQDAGARALFDEHFEIPAVPVLISRDKLLIGFDQEKMLSLASAAVDS